MLNGNGWSIDCDRIRTMSRHFGVCLPMKITSLVCSQLRRARTDGLPIGDGLYRSSGITLSLPFGYQTSDGCKFVRSVLNPTIICRGNRSEPYKRKARKIDMDAETRRF